MTDEEDARNAELAEQMRACEHDPFFNPETRGVRCRKCGGLFLLLLPERKLKPFPINPEDYE